MDRGTQMSAFSWLHDLCHGAGRRTEIRSGTADQQTWWNLQWRPRHGEVIHLKLKLELVGTPV